MSNPKRPSLIDIALALAIWGGAIFLFVGTISYFFGSTGLWIAIILMLILMFGGG